MSSNAKKTWKIIGFFAVVIAVSSITAITTNRLSSMGKSAYSDTTYNQTPASFTNYRTVRSGLETDFTMAAERSIHAVVHVRVKTPARQSRVMSDPFFEYFFGRPYQQGEAPMQEGSGSGVIISPDGYIVTNNHVIDKSKEIEVTLNDKRSFKATLVGADPSTDIALLKIEGSNFATVPFGDSDSLKVGEWVLAVGNPFNLTSTVTAGIVSAKARNINILNSDMKIESFIQTDAAINAGNSGGALVNTNGELVGINTAIASQTGSYAGYGFAVPSSIVQKIVADLRKHGTVQRAVLGTQIRDITNQFAEEKDLKSLDGAYVAGIMKNSAAEKAGMKEGDIVTNINGTRIGSVAELQEQIGRYSPGDKIKVNVLRGDKNISLDVELKNREGSTDIVLAPKGSEALGATLTPIDKNTVSKLGISGGLQVKSLKKGKLADAGVKEGYIILKVNNMNIRSEEDLQSAIDAAYNSDERDKVLFITGAYPNGRVAHFAINLSE